MLVRNFIDEFDRYRAIGEKAMAQVDDDALNRILAPNGNSILADLRRTIDPDTVWGRFNVGREGTIRWYRRVYERLRELAFEAPIMDELRQVAEELERWSEVAATR